ncbi:CotH kinase family protein [Tissierella sp. Yu-01]|uniref:CotH kinase family protein n=1 Tax=Tissierella sp. Yu-01 TaxID=3035694 RepID=UPI00240D2F1D|nr:CotH kinase family protein [Tissierella sp. Yu-01]WFA10149.1 CotH kinase family protein [Tissierella sp. Yu-01]
MKLRDKIIILIIIIAILLIFQSIKEIKKKIESSNISFKDLYWNFSYVKSNSLPLEDNPLIYTHDNTKIHDVYLIILPTTDEENNSITFSDLNGFTDFREEKPVLNAHLVNTDSSSFEISTIENLNLITNANLTLRGHSTMLSDKKSYRIELGDYKESFLGYKILNLNKHPFDSYKVRNKIAFELFSDIPNMVSLRTNLINLYIKDLTNPEEDEFVNYGLYTHIEQPNEDFLKTHNLDHKGHLYKAEFFEFFRYEDSIRNMDDPLYNDYDFSYYLELKVGDNHEKIINMLDDVNNYNLDINKILDKHFNRDNYFTWLAVNILLGNYDTKTQNYYLYSPHDTHVWYILPWDYDGSMGEDLAILQNADGKFQALVGIANYWNSVLHNRVFRDQENVKQLNEMIEEVYKTLTREKMYATASKYFDIVKKESTLSNEELLEQLETITNSPEINRKLYYETLEKPMPVYLGEAVEVDGSYYFYWENSFDLQGDRISYTFQISKTPNFTDIVYERNRLRTAEITADIEPGQYYWRVVAIDSKGNTQRAFDQLILDDGRLYHGLKYIVIE